MDYGELNQLGVPTGPEAAEELLEAPDGMFLAMDTNQRGQIIAQQKDSVLNNNRHGNRFAVYAKKPSV